MRRATCTSLFILLCVGALLTQLGFPTVKIPAKWNLTTSPRH